MDREKVIKGVHDARRYLEDREWVDKSVGVHIDALNDAIALLKEQEHKDKMFHALEDDWKRLKELLKEQEAVVRCKDCKHGEKVNSVYLCGKSRGFGIAHEPDWFCADGERKEGR